MSVCPTGNGHCSESASDVSLQHQSCACTRDVCWPQDYRVHIKHTDGHFEHVPYFSLPANDLTDVIAPSCYSCFDYPNALADLVGACCLIGALPLTPISYFPA